MGYSAWKNRVIGQGSMKSNWRLSFNLAPSKTSPDWQTCLRITDHAPGNERNVLGLWFIPDTLHMRMHFAFDITDNNQSGNPPAFDVPPLTVNEQNTIEISQMVKDGKTVLVFKLNGYTYHNKVNENPHMYPALDFYYAMGSWNGVSADMRDFQYYSSDLATDIPAVSGT